MNKGQRNAAARPQQELMGQKSWAWKLIYSGFCRKSLAALCKSNQEMEIMEGTSKWAGMAQQLWETCSAQACISL